MMYYVEHPNRPTIRIDERGPTEKKLKSLYSKFNEFRIDEKYTDVCIHCEDETFKCHRLVLSATSKYFKTMFNGNFAESQMSNITLHGIDGATFKEVLRFVYCDDLSITDNNVYSLLYASDFLRMPYVEELCVEYLKMSIPNNNALEIFAFARTLNKMPLITLLSGYILRYVHHFSKTTEFLEISFDDLITILKEGKYTRHNEDTLLDAITRWLHHSYHDRQCYIQQLFNHIEFRKISKRYIINYFNNYPIDSVLSDDPSSESQPERKELSLYVYVNTQYNFRREQCTNIFKYRLQQEDSSSPDWFHFRQIEPYFNGNAMRLFTPDNDHLYCLKRSDVINFKRYLLNFSVHSSIDLFSKLSLKSPPFLINGDFDMCSVMNNSDIFLYDKYVKGAKVPSITILNDSKFNEEEICRGIYVYKCGVDEWFPVPATKTLLTNSGVTADNRRVYLIGGALPDDSIPKGYAQAYDVRTAQWHELPQSENKYQFSSCCFHKGKIYVLGGDGDRGGPASEVYDPVAGKWETLKPSARRGEYCHRLLSYDNQLWAFCSASLASDKLHVERCDEITKEWNDFWSLQDAIGKAYPVNRSPKILDAVAFRSSE